MLKKGVFIILTCIIIVLTTTVTERSFFDPWFTNEEIET